MARVSFEGRVVVVTGAGQGLGRCHAEAFAARGAKVVVNDMGGAPNGDGADASFAEQVASAIRDRGGEAVASTDSVEQGARVIECAMDSFGRVDVVVNNAGILRDQAFHKLSDEDWDRVFRVHVNGSFQVTRAAWPHMREQGYGRVVMTASAAGLYGNFGQANYAAAKLGLHGLAQTLAVEGAAKGVFVNTVAPVAASRLTATVMAPGLLAALKPELVSPLVVYLASEACAETGQLFEAGGGVVTRLRWQRSEGAAFDPAVGFSPEDLVAAWPQVQAFARGDHPASVADSFAPIARNAGVELVLQKQ